MHIFFFFHFILALKIVKQTLHNCYYLWKLNNKKKKSSILLLSLLFLSVILVMCSLLHSSKVVWTKYDNHSLSDWRFNNNDINLITYKILKQCRLASSCKRLNDVCQSDRICFIRPNSQFFIILNICSPYFKYASS